MRLALHLRWMIAAVVAAGLLGALLVSGPVLAGNGKGKGQQTENSGSATCLGEVSGETLHLSGSGSGSHSFGYCSDPTFSLRVLLDWDNAMKDLGLKVIAPDGTVHVIDHENTHTESYYQGAPLPEGIWTVEVINNGHGNVDYRLSVTVS